MALFVDNARILVKAGNGGDGCVSFHREKFVQRGGPDGGDGGNGGDVMLASDANMHTLMDFRYTRKLTAEDGEAGSAGNCKGKSGKALTIRVPVGTLVRDVNTGRVLADMRTAGEERLLLRGGRGGFGNARFATPTRRAPNFAKPGERNESREVELELKSIADVGLVGFPNVGKSTILSVVTSARPKIANYHFTTLAPNLGIVKAFGIDYVMADIPGLIEGAHMGTGLGHDFLRHVERTRLLVHVLDISGSEGRDPVADFDTINAELARYGELKNRRQIIAANKTDLPGAAENIERLRAHVGGDAKVLPISAATREGFPDLLKEIARTLPTLEGPEPEEEWNGLLEEASDDSFDISRDGGAYLVSGAGADRLVASVNFGDADSLHWFHQRLRRLGVIDRLREAGADEGDTVVLGGMEFDFTE